MRKRQPKNLAGRMGKRSPQPTTMMQATVNPLTRLDQKSAGRMMGGKKQKKSGLYG